MTDYWGRFSDSYDLNQEYVVGTELISRLKAEVRALPSLGLVTELGCGTGLFSELLAPKAEHLTSTDLSEEMLGVARARLQGVENATLQREDCMQLSLPDASVDSVFMANLIHVVESPERVLREARRVLKPGGLLVIASFTTDGMSRWESAKLVMRFLKTWGKPPQSTHTFSPESLASLVSDAGLSVQRAELIGARTKSIFLVANTPAAGA